MNYFIFKSLCFKRFLEFEIADKGLEIYINILYYHMTDKEIEGWTLSNCLSSHSSMPEVGMETKALNSTLSSPSCLQGGGHISQGDGKFTQAG